MNNAKLTVTAAILAIALAGAFSETLAKDTDRAKAKLAEKAARKAKAAASGPAEHKVRRYAAIYNLDQEAQDKLMKMFEAQAKDLADYQKVHGPKIQAVNDQIAKIRADIAKLNADIAKLEASKSVHKEAMKELQLDHKAEIDSVITTRYKISRLAGVLKGDRSGYWKYLPKEVQASVDEKCQAAAVELIATEKADSRTALYEARTKINESLAKIITPEMKKSAEREYLKQYVLRGFARYELTEDQKARIGELCEKTIADRTAAMSRYEQLAKDYAAVRQSISKYKGSLVFHELRAEAAKSVLTEEQREKLPGKFRTSKEKVSKDKRARKSKSAKKAPAEEANT